MFAAAGCRELGGLVLVEQKGLVGYTDWDGLEFGITVLEGDVLFDACHIELDESGNRIALSTIDPYDTSALHAELEHRQRFLEEIIEKRISKLNVRSA